eukprot:CAMPEP_0201902158 /NCGR_PEP_ID=MMETSP0902-20130614/54811_1 /ASSEMBLY_ACC=CAM_ASM_000551 /TAXON_ID=420261 /ORGANISM="Thalassiosira antarctica, Strain CCMP982" /LENGTH=38 /DNA_ID= /DNA_START= /DNA_END= /DNA_ORIENTATION=
MAHGIEFAFGDDYGGGVSGDGVPDKEAEAFAGGGEALV